MRKSQGKITDSQNQTKYTNQTGKRHTTNHSYSTADTAGTFDRIFTVLMTQMEQLRPLLTVENPGAKKIVRKMITSI